MKAIFPPLIQRVMRNSCPHHKVCSLPNPLEIMETFLKCLGETCNWASEASPTLGLFNRDFA